MELPRQKKLPKLTHFHNLNWCHIQTLLKHKKHYARFNVLHKWIFMFYRHIKSSHFSFFRVRSYFMLIFLRGNSKLYHNPSIQNVPPLCFTGEHALRKSLAFVISFSSKLCFQKRKAAPWINIKNGYEKCRNILCSQKSLLMLAS